MKNSVFLKQMTTMNTDKIVWGALALALGFGGGVLGAYWLAPGQAAEENKPALEVRSVVYENDARTLGTTGPDFSAPAAAASPSVVFIKTLSNRRVDSYWDFWNFYGRRGPVSSAGSGVIISDDGYIVTNNHVIEDADKIEVVLNDKHTYSARIVGVDRNTDLALLKIEPKRKLQAIPVGNSDKVRIGEWVLALGNPLNLISTVTAGIVSAKGRNINIVHTEFPIESFIQTDAAINPGNSGGALVNAAGELVGINTAIASKTGAYSGYGFAIPSNIVKKVVKDLIEHGEVQRAFLGADVADIDAALADKLPDDDFSGVFIEDVAPESAAEQAGLKTGDVILKIDEHTVESKAEYLERLSYYRPGDKVVVTARRGKGLKTFSATLTNREGTTALLKNESVYSSALGCSITPLSKVERQRLGVEGGFRLGNIKSGKVANMGLRDGFVVLSVNRKTPSNVAELINVLQNSRGRLVIEGVDANGSRATYQFFTY